MIRRDLSRISLHRLRVFRRVVELGGVKRAAEELLVSQPVVSEHLGAIERVVGSKLFYWEGRRLQLTASGEVVYEMATTILTRLDESNRRLDDIASSDHGQLVIGGTATLATYRLPSVAIRLHEKHPQLRITIESFPSATILKAVLDGACDVGMIFEGTEFNSPSVDYERLFIEPIELVTIPENAVGSPLDTADLEDLPYVCAPQSQARRTTLDRDLRDRGIKRRRIGLEFSQPEAIKSALYTGAGFAFMLRCSVERELERGDLVRVPVNFEPIGVGCGLWVRRGRPTTAAQEAAMQEMRALRDGGESERLLLSAE